LTAVSLSPLAIRTPLMPSQPTPPVTSRKENEPMSEVIILEFAGGTADHYLAVNKILGVDGQTGEGDWPPALQSHTAAVGAAGLVVVEVWESKEAQASFMAQLAPALSQAGVPEPTRMEWLSLLGRYNA
jgi:hypothetical protein